MTTKISTTQNGQKITPVALGIANIGAGNGFDVPLPPGAILESLLVYTETAFDGTTNTLTVSDGTTTFVNAVDVKSTGSETVANVPKYFPSGGTLHVTMAQTGTATVGRVFFTGAYSVVGKADQVYVGTGT